MTMFKPGDKVKHKKDSPHKDGYKNFGWDPGDAATVFEIGAQYLAVVLKSNAVCYVGPEFMELSEPEADASLGVISKSWLGEPPTMPFVNTVESAILFTKAEGVKSDQGKPGMDLIPYDALAEVARVLDFGAQKYSPGNWAKGMKLSRLIAACERHLGEFKEGRDIDPESSLNHIAHATCNLLFMLWMIKHRPDMDNRWIKEANK